MFVIYTFFLDVQIYSPLPLWHLKLISCFKNFFSTTFFFFMDICSFLPDYLFIYLFLAVLGLRFVQGLSLVAASGGHSSSRCAGLSLSWPLLLAEHRLQTRRLSSCGSRAQLLRGMWDLPRPGLELLSPALAGRFPTTAPPGKPSTIIFKNKITFLLVYLWFLPLSVCVFEPRGCLVLCQD